MAKWVGLYPACLALSGSIVGQGQCLPTPPVSASSIYAAIVCVGGLGSVCYIWSISHVLSGVLCEFKDAPSNSVSLFHSLLSEDLSPRTMPQDYLA